MNQYAPEGYHYASVMTGQVFAEHLLPMDAAKFSAKERQDYARLQELAERHGVSMTFTSYRRG